MSPNEVKLARKLADFLADLLTEYDIESDRRFRADGPTGYAPDVEAYRGPGACGLHPDCTLPPLHDGACIRGEAPVTYSLPGAPVTGRRVTTSTTPGDPYAGGALIFRKEPDGTFTCLALAEISAPDNIWSWSGILATFGTVTLIPLTDKEKEHEKLYGPLGARWGDPFEPCPYRGCRLGVGHIQAHLDRDGNPILVDLDALAASADLNVSPQEAAETPCNCGHPERHTPECPRGQRIYGTLNPDYPYGISGYGPGSGEGAF